jgi:SAM-dependent methyltransferase
MKALLKKVYRLVFPHVSSNLKNELANCSTVLDLGCGNNSLLQHFSVPSSVGVDLFNPYLQESKKKKYHTQYIKADIRKLEFKPKSFDAVIAFDVLEHLTKEEGTELLGRMEKWARMKLIILTPNGFMQQDSYDNNPLQKHRSGWTVEELKRSGFAVFGINGWKRLRGYQASIKYKPAFIYGTISDFTQKITYRIPQLAFQLLAIKTVEEK